MIRRFVFDRLRLAAVAAAAMLLAGAAPAYGLCGDGIFDPGEACDDGNLSDADCCSASCTLQACSVPAQPGVAWQALGPFDVGGRVTALAVDPSDPDTLLIGTPAAGVWRSEDRGASWAVIAQWLDAAPVSALAIDPAQSDRYFVATGVLQDSGTVGDALGSLWTNDAGQTWSFQSDPTLTAYVGDVLLWPDEPQRVLIAGDRGLVLSTDGGSTLSAVETGDSFTTVLRDPFDADVVFASGRVGFYESVDRGATWSFVSAWPGIDDFENPAAATAVLAVSHQMPGLLRAAVQDLATFADTDRIILLESADGGTSWTELPVPAALCPEKDLCGFANALAIDPGNDARMLLGGDRLFRSEDGGQSWTPLDASIRGVHEIEIDFMGAVVAGRSGVAVLDASWQTVTLRNDGLPITQIVGLDAKQDGSGDLLVATADSGTVLGAGDPFEWQVVLGAGQAASEARFDPFDPDVLYAGLRRGDFSRSDDGGASWSTITSGLSPTQTATNVAPLAANPLIEGELFTGRLQLFRSGNRGDSWTEHRPPGAPEIALIAPSPVIDDRLYFALTKGGTLFKNDGINTDAFDLDPALDARITSIYPDPAAENRVYVTITNTATLSGALWRTEDFGVTWQDRGFDKLPAVNDVVRDEFGALYLATPDGIFRSVSEGFVWSPFDEALPTKNVTKILVDEGYVVAGTRGRGLFQVPARPLVSIDTIPPGQRLLVDGVLREGPVYEDWAAGSQHTIEPYLLQTQDTRQEFVSWLDGGPQERVFTATGDNEWPTALVKVLHRLSTQVSPPEGGSLIIEPPVGGRLLPVPELRPADRGAGAGPPDQGLVWTGRERGPPAGERQHGGPALHHRRVRAAPHQLLDAASRARDQHRRRAGHHAPALSVGQGLAPSAGSSGQHRPRPERSDGADLRSLERLPAPRPRLPDAERDLHGGRHGLLPAGGARDHRAGRRRAAHHHPGRAGPAARGRAHPRAGGRRDAPGERPVPVQPRRSGADQRVRADAWRSRDAHQRLGGRPNPRGQGRAHRRRSDPAHTARACSTRAARRPPSTWCSTPRTARPRPAATMCSRWAPDSSAW